MTEPAKLRPSRRRWRWLLLLVVSLTLVAAWLYLLAADRRLRRAIAEADRLDPRWRLADIEADRAAVPDEDNGALTVIAAKAKLPAAWNSSGPNGPRAFGAPAPNVALTDTQAAALRDYLEPAGAALQEARKLTDRPRGRWPASGKYFDALTVGNLLANDALDRTRQGDLDTALASCRAMVNAGRSAGDEPRLMAPMIRLALDVTAIQKVEYVLGQGEPGEPALAALQALLAEEGNERSLTLALRGERARTDQMLESLQNGDTTVKQLLAATRGPLAKKPWVSKEDLLYLPGVTANSRAAVLERWNELVEISKLPPQEQADRLAGLTAARRDEPLVVRLTSPETVARYASDAWETKAPLLCAVVGLAAERYRLANHRWPQSLDDLKGDFLREIPLDPFDGQPLRYHKDADGVVIYSVGPSRKDNGGDRSRVNTGPPRGSDIGFRLWDVSRRRLPPPAPKPAGQPDIPPTGTP